MVSKSFNIFFYTFYTTPNLLHNHLSSYWPSRDMSIAKCHTLCTVHVCFCGLTIVSSTADFIPGKKTLLLNYKNKIIITVLKHNIAKVWEKLWERYGCYLGHSLHYVYSLQIQYSNNVKAHWLWHVTWLNVSSHKHHRGLVLLISMLLHWGMLYNYLKPVEKIWICRKPATNYSNTLNLSHNINLFLMHFFIVLCAFMFCFIPRVIVCEQISVSEWIF